MKVIFSTNFWQNTYKIVRAVFEKNIKVSDFGLETFLRISPNQEFFFKNPALWLFYLYSPLTSCKKSEKPLVPFLRKLRYQPTNQPTNQLLRTTPILQDLADASPKNSNLKDSQEYLDGPSTTHLSKYSKIPSATKLSQHDWLKILKGARNTFLKLEILFLACFSLIWRWCLVALYSTLNIHPSFYILKGNHFLF